MKYKLQSDHPVTNEAAKAATGKTLDQWFAELDKRDGLKLGRRAINLSIMFKPQRNEEREDFLPAFLRILRFFVGDFHSFSHSRILRR